jgi:hypothetical protein
MFEFTAPSILGELYTTDVPYYELTTAAFGILSQLACKYFIKIQVK